MKRIELTNTILARVHSATASHWVMPCSLVARVKLAPEAAQPLRGQFRQQLTDYARASADEWQQLAQRRGVAR